MSWTSRLASHLDSAESAIDTPAKLDTLRRFYQTILRDQEEERECASSPLAEFLPRLFELQSDESPPVRKIVSEIIGEIGLKRVELVPEIVSVLMRVVEDPTPAVAKQAIKCGICLFGYTLRKIALQGLYTSDLGEMLKSSWVSVQEFKEKIHSLAFQAGSGGVRLLALKSLEAVILLYTPDPNGTHEPTVPEAFSGDSSEFNISWVRGGHPVLNAGDLSIEASKMLNLLLDQLRLPTIKSLSNLVIIVLTKSLATIAKKRPPYYGRILPVLLGVDPSNSVLKGTHAYGARLALKNAFLSCLNCTHPGAAPWRERLAGALREVKLGGVAEEILHQTSNPDENKEEHETKSNFLDVKEAKPLFLSGDDATSILGRKRSGLEDDVTSAEDNDLMGKRARSMSDSEGPLRDLCESAMDIKEDTAGSAGKRSTDDSGPVQQLVAMFGALVAQGEKAVGSLEILISSISADLLAEVVMANMRHLPPSQSYAEGDDVSLENMTMEGSDSEAKYPLSFLAGVLSLTTSYPQVVSRLHVNRSIPDKKTAPKIEEERLKLPDYAFDYNLDHHIGEVEPEIQPPSVPLSSNDAVSKMEEEILPSMSDIHEVDDLDGEIPGLDSSARSDRISENTRTSSLISADFEDANREQFASVSSRSSLDAHPSTSTERSEELSPKGAATDASSIISSTGTSTGLPTIVVLPKMSAPVVNLDDGQKDQLQSLVFVSIIEAYRHIAVAGGSQVRFSLLAHLGVEFPSDVDPWKPLQNHILSDYVNLEGHELTLRVLYRLFSVVEEDRDFFSSSTAATAYEMFLLAVAETLRESFPPTDKFLSKLLGEAPYLPKSILNLLESLCCPGNREKTEESHSGDRVTQGLSTVWSLILHRPPLRESCLKIALQSAVHHLEEVRMKAIRLVANKLFPLPTVSQQIEDFAKEMLVSVAQVDVADADGLNTESQKDPVLEKQSNENQSVSAISRDISSDTHQSCTSKRISPLSTSEAQRCMSLYFALCTKKHSLFRHVFLVYKSASKDVKQAVRLHIPILVRTIGSSSGLLEIISDPPLGSEELLLQVLQTLTDRIVPSPELLATIRKLYEKKLKDAEILIPILPFLPKDEVLVIFPQLVNLPPVKFQAALAHILQGSSHSGAMLTPAEVLIAIHGIDPDRDSIPLKKVTDACNACFEQPQIFTQQVIAKVLNQLVEQIPLPLLFMRTVLQAIGAYPALVDFVLEILSRLVSKQIWKYPKLWVGFLRCAFLTKPQSFSVLLQLPPQQLENALNRTPALKAPLVAHASQSNIKSSLPRSVLGVLGIGTDAPTASQAQTVDTNNSDKEAQTEVTKESSNAT